MQKRRRSSLRNLAVGVVAFFVSSCCSDSESMDQSGRVREKGRVAGVLSEDDLLALKSSEAMFSSILMDRSFARVEGVPPALSDSHRGLDADSSAQLAQLLTRHSSYLTSVDKGCRFVPHVAVHVDTDRAEFDFVFSFDCDGVKIFRDRQLECFVYFDPVRRELAALFARLYPNEPTKSFL